MEAKEKNKILNLKDKLETAKLYHRSGKLQQAENLYREILKEEPQNAEATHLLGLLAVQTGKLDIGKHLIETAIELNPDDPVFYVNLGVIYYLKKDFEKAKELFRKALEMDNFYFEAHANLGKLLAEENLLEEARVHLVKAVNLGDTDQSTLITLAEVNLRLGFYDRVEELCKQMIHELDIENVQVMELLVESLIKQNKVTEAIPYVELLLDHDKENPKYKNYLDEIYKSTGILDSPKMNQ